MADDELKGNEARAQWKAGETAEGAAPPNELRAQLRERPHLLALERYNIEAPWSQEHVARDVWQNFFDANNYTADGIRIETTQEEDGRHRITMRGDSDYPFNRLVFFGSGVKEDPNRSAGGKHEGTKMIALSLLRDYGADEVIFGSQDWELVFYLADPPFGAVDEHMEPQQALYVRLREKQHEAGNYMTFKTREENMGEVFVRAKDLFYHSENPDFKHPDVDNDSAGFRFHEGEKGSFYLNGQRIHVEDRNEWNTIPNFTFWSRRTPEWTGQRLTLGRDRDVIPESDVRFVFLPFLVQSMSSEERKLTLVLLEPFFEATPEKSDQFSITFLREVIRALVNEGYRTTFNAKYISDDLFGQFSDTLRALGYIVCHRELASLGMVSASEILKEVRELQEVEPSPEEAKRARLLIDVVVGFVEGQGRGMEGDMRRLERNLRTGDQRAVRSQRRPAVFGDIAAKDISLFAREHPYANGKYDMGTVWLSHELMHEQHPDRALAIYLHELCHPFGSDESAEFSYALTIVLERWNRYLRENPEVLSDLDREWQETRVSSEWQNLPDMEEAVAPLLRELHENERFQYDDRALFSHQSHTEEAAEAISFIVTNADSPTFVPALERFYTEICAHPAFQEYERLMSRMREGINEQEIKNQKDRIADERRGIRERADGIRRQIQTLEEKLPAKRRQHARERSKIPGLEEELRPLERQIESLDAEYDRLREMVPDNYEFEIALAAVTRARIQGYPVDLLSLGSSDLFIGALRLLKRGRKLDKVPWETMGEIIATLRRLNPNGSLAVDNALLLELNRAVEEARAHDLPEDLRYARLIYDALVKS